MTTVRAFQCPCCISFDLVGDFTDRFINQIEFARRAAIGRHDVDRVAKRPDQQAPREKALVETGTNVGHIAGVAGYDIERSDGSDLANIRKTPILTEAIEPLGVQGGQTRDALHNRLSAPNLQIRESGRARDRVRGI
jgi:hypothetical protein